jgi:hypothetical protein
MTLRQRILGQAVTVLTNSGSPHTLTRAHAGLILVDASAASVVINLPAASGFKWQFQFRRIDAHATRTVTINRAGSDTVTSEYGGGEAATSYLLGRAGYADIVCDALTKWYVVDDFEYGEYTGTGQGFTTSPTDTLRFYRRGRAVTLMMGSSIIATSNASPTTITGEPARLRPISDAGWSRVNTTSGGSLNNNGRMRMQSSGGLDIEPSPISSFAGSGEKGIYPFIYTYFIRAE